MSREHEQKNYPSRKISTRVPLPFQGWGTTAPVRSARNISRAFLHFTAAFVLLLSGCDHNQPSESSIVVGSKRFTESNILAETLRLIAVDRGIEAEHKRNMGSRIVFDALSNGSVDAYVEYTGTLKRELLADRNVSSDEQLAAALRDDGISMSKPLGFDNTYVLGIRRDLAKRKNIKTISDLIAHPELRIGFSSEFMNREDGWPALRARYQLPHEDVRGMEHDLAYRAIESEALDVIDLYSTDAKIEQYDLVRLEDDYHHFPQYRAVILYRSELDETQPQLVKAWKQLEGALDEEAMTALNAKADIDGLRPGKVASEYLQQAFDIDVKFTDITLSTRLWTTTRQHLLLVGQSMFGAIIIGLAFGILAAKSNPLISQTILGAVSIVQTIPAIALLVFMIPVFQTIGAVPAIAALFLYSLLPIVRNTHSGLHSIAGGLRESAEALGLPAGARMWLVELPLAARSILTGIKTATVINIGTATLGGFIGAGGYGEPILTGINRASTETILEGAIPAALMALAAQGIFELADRLFISKGLRLARS